MARPSKPRMKDILTKQNYTYLAQTDTMLLHPNFGKGGEQDKTDLDNGITH